MSLQTQLTPMLDDIRRRWIELIFATYPSDASGFLSREKDQFANPVGFAIRQATATLLDSVVTGRSEHTAEALDQIVRIRSVQDFTASAAVSFVFLLKQAITDVAGELVAKDARAWLELDERIDGLALEAFDVFMQCREQLFTIRLAEQDRWNASARLKRQRGLPVSPSGMHGTGRKEHPRR